MKPWAVIRYQEESEAWAFERRRRDTDPQHITWIQRHEEYEWGGERPSAECSIFWCESEADANQLASNLSGWYPSNIYIVTKSSRMVRREPGPERVAVFNEKGLMPL